MENENVSKLNAQLNILETNIILRKKLLNNKKKNYTINKEMLTSLNKQMEKYNEIYASNDTNIESLITGGNLNYKSQYESLFKLNNSHF